MQVIHHLKQLSKRQTNPEFSFSEVKAEWKHLPLIPDSTSLRIH